MRVRSIELVQRIEYLDLIHITNVLNEKSCIKDYALITHDKDVKEDGTPVAPHLHLMMRFSEVQDTKYIAKWFNVGEQYLCKIKGRFADALMYLTHENAPEKYQYSEDDVISNFDFRKEKEKKSNNLRREEIINKIACGEIREFNLFDSVNAIEYDKYRRNIENAFLYRQKILLKEINREMEVVFISGASGSGKTTYAKMMCENQNYSYFISSSSNDPFDGYAGQDAVILDDLRGSSFTFADLLKITDNHTSSSVK
ncbi:Rep family protein, partial [Bacteroides finegoldii]|uniref:Rep family protein n=1 Tax=Bacteroides finegoldii TaxID=338188 RepID=UPI0032F09278